MIIFSSTLPANNNCLRHLASHHCHSRRSKNLLVLPVNLIIDAVQYFLFILPLRQAQGESGVGGHQYFFFIFTLRSPLILTLRPQFILALRPPLTLTLHPPLTLILSLSKDESGVGKRQELSKFTIGK